MEIFPQDNSQEESKKPKSLLKKAVQGTVVAGAMLGLTACGPDEAASHIDKVSDSNSGGATRVDSEKTSNQEKTAVFLQEYHDYFERGIEPVAHRTDFEKKMGIFKDSWAQRSKARAIEIALKNGIYVGGDKDTITFSTHEHVPTDITVNGQRVPFFSGDYSAAENASLGIGSLSEKSERKVLEQESNKNGGSLSSKTVVSPEAEDFL